MAVGFEPIPLAADEFTRAGGGIKCLIMEVHGRPPDPATASPTIPATTNEEARR